jgi:hypothetical protein
VRGQAALCVMCVFACRYMFPCLCLRVVSVGGCVSSVFVARACLCVFLPGCVCGGGNGAGTCSYERRRHARELSAIQPVNQLAMGGGGGGGARAAAPACARACVYARVFVQSRHCGARTQAGRTRASGPARTWTQSTSTPLCHGPPLAVRAPPPLPLPLPPLLPPLLSTR